MAMYFSEQFLKKEQNENVAVADYGLFVVWFNWKAMVCQINCRPLVISDRLVGSIEKRMV